MEKIMEKITLIKDNQKREFSPRAAQIAMEHLGWYEFQPLPKPVELTNKVLLKKVLPPLITKPKVIEPEYPGDEKKVELIPEVVPESIVEELPVKKTRKPSVRSKSVKK